MSERKDLKSSPQVNLPRRDMLKLATGAAGLAFLQWRAATRSRPTCFTSCARMGAHCQ
ncbi:MAG: hypothetical protein ACLGJB_24280 [Blastocatellia bacterium]